MSLWTIIPRDPVIFRDGKPFTAVPGERSKSLVFPYPSTIAGAVRTLAGTDVVSGQFDKPRVGELLQKVVRGPLLVELDGDDQVLEWFFPAPADALLIQDETGDQTLRYRLAPLEPKGFTSDLKGLNLVGPSKIVKDKPLSNPPRYWRREAFEDWLRAPGDGTILPDKIGIQGPRREYRMHVSINPGTKTAQPGALFQTSGMEFAELKPEPDETPELHKVRSLALVVETDADLREGMDVLGGERRAVRWQKSRSALPECPERVKETILNQPQGACRLVLLTPACFESGFLPAWLKKEFGANVIAAALPRYQTISGWDFEKPGPKPTRRLAPAGSVYFLKFAEKADIQNFIKHVWMQAVSDKEQDRRDGFGLAALGTWDGQLREMEVQHEQKTA